MATGRCRRRAAPSHRRSRLSALADGRRAFERRGAVGDVLGGERQVVRAGLDGQRHAGRPRRGESLVARSRTRGGRCGCGLRTPRPAATSSSIAAYSLASGRLFEPRRIRRGSLAVPPAAPASERRKLGMCQEWQVKRRQRAGVRREGPPRSRARIPRRRTGTENT